jgi:hypothetical protein
MSLFPFFLFLFLPFVSISCLHCVAVPVVVFLDVPDEFELPPKEHHIEREKRLSLNSRRDSFLSEQSLSLVLDNSLLLAMDSSISKDTSLSFDG